MALLPRKRDWPATSPLRNEFQRLQRELTQFLPALGFEEPLAAGAWNPSVDIYEDEKGIRLHADVPGIDLNDIDIQLDENVLTLTGKRDEAKEEKRENYQRMERFYGEFRRSFTLPDYADAAKIEASCKNGVLEISIPSKPEAGRGKAKHIAIKAD
jgi:HSP20 family protein